MNLIRSRRWPWLLPLALSACMHRADAQRGHEKQAGSKPAPSAPPALPSEPATSKQEAPKQAVERASAKSAPRLARRSPLGTNLDAINDWSPSFPFVDAMKRSRDWISTDGDKWDDERSLALDESGWVKSLQKGQKARTLLFWDVSQYPAGDYTVTWNGTGSFDYSTGKVVSRKGTRQVVHIDGRSNFALLLESVGSPYPHPIKVLMPGGACSNDSARYCDRDTPCEQRASCVPFEHNPEQQIFHPKFLERIAPYSVVRFMDWMKTNESKERSWKDRPKPSDARWNHGVPLEIMVALANRMSLDPWFNIPHAADDEYVTKFATYVRDNLRPELTAYVEYSNEVWNGIFPQAHYATEQGEKLKLGKGWEAQSKFHAKRSTEVHKLWEQVFKGKMDRIVRVLATQVANYGVAAGLLEYGDTKHHVDALAVAPYFGGEYMSPEEAGKWENQGLDAWFKDVYERSLPRQLEAVKAHAELAKKYDIDLIAYEGGESFAGIGGTEDNVKLNRLADQIGRDPRMKQVYLTYLDGWRKAGGELFVHFTDCVAPGKYGRWGSMEHLEQPRAEAPKYDALLTFIDKNERWW